MIGFQGIHQTLVKITPDGTVTPYAGGMDQAGHVDGPAASARFWNLNDIVIDAQDNLYLSESGNNCIRKVTPAGMVSTLAGGPSLGGFDGPAGQGGFYEPLGLDVDRQGNLYVVEAGRRVRKVSPDGTVTTLAGSGFDSLVGRDGQGTSARFTHLSGIAVADDGTLYVADDGAIRRITPTGWVDTVVGDLGRSGTVSGPLPAGVAPSARLRINPVTGQLWVSLEDALLVVAF